MSLVLPSVNSELEKCHIGPLSPPLASCSLQHGRVFAHEVLRERVEAKLRQHELLVFGAYIDHQIVPGFKYKVRKIDNSQELFDGEALVLEGVGQGYGKRLTFNSDDVLYNENFFWSDSNEFGYAFSIAAIVSGDEFDAVSSSGATLGRAVVRSVSNDQEIVSSTIHDGCHFKEVHVEFSCRLDLENGRHIPANGCVVKGTVTLCKRNRQPVTVEEIVLEGSNELAISRLRPKTQ